MIEQAQKQAQRLAPLPPRGGKRLPLLPKGKSGNPKGSSTKVRMQKAFDAVIASVDVEQGVRAAWNVACDQRNPLHLQALKWLFDRGVGPVVDTASVKVEVVTVLRFEERRDEREAEVVPQRVTAASSARQLQAPEGDEEIQ